MKRISDLLSRSVILGVAAIIVLAPTQFSFEIVPRTWLSPVDPVIWLTAAAWLSHIAIERRWRQLCLPPLPAILFIGIACASAVANQVSIKTGKEIFQLVEYFIAAYVVLAGILANPIRLRWAVHLLLVTATLVIALGWLHYLTPDLPDLLVRSSFGNRNVLGGYLSMVIPLAAGILFNDTHVLRRLWCLTLVLAGLALTLSGASWLAMALACLLVAAMHSTRTLLATVITLLLFAMLIIPGLPRQKNGTLMNSIRIYNEDAQISNRYPEWDAALLMIRENPWLGVGPGLYQDNIGSCFGSLPDAPSEKAEADSENLYLVTASSVGILGLTAFIALLMYFGGKTLHAWRITTDPWRCGLAAGILGSLIAYSINGIWSPLLVRGIGVQLAIIFAISAGLSLKAEESNNS